MIKQADIKEQPHRRLNLLTGEWILVSPHRTKRPWQGKVEAAAITSLPAYDHNCYLCPGNKRADGTANPHYPSVYSFVNDYAALLPESPEGVYNENDLLVANNVTGKCKVICFSPRHDLTLPLLKNEDIENVITLWCREYAELSMEPDIRYIQIFENKGEIMGCSNPHPHGQVWASTNIPVELQKETTSQLNYFSKYGSSLLKDYLALELSKQVRIVVENESFVALVPFWAVWPYETMIISKRHLQNILQFKEGERRLLADMLKRLTVKYDNLFQTSFPYSAGMHQAPVNNRDHPEWHWHMHFYPPLLRSSTVKKFMVGYEMLANPQRDITAEWAAERLRSQSEIHYLENSKMNLTGE